MTPLQAPASQVGAGAAVPTISASLQQLGIHPAVPALHSAPGITGEDRPVVGPGCPWSSGMEGCVQSTGSSLPPTARSAFTNKFCSTWLSWTQPPCCGYSLGALNPCGAEVWLPRSVLSVSCSSNAASAVFPEFTHGPAVWQQEIWAVCYERRQNLYPADAALLLGEGSCCLQVLCSCPHPAEISLGHPCTPRFGCSFS